MAMMVMPIMIIPVKNMKADTSGIAYYDKLKRQMFYPFNRSHHDVNSPIYSEYIQHLVTYNQKTH